VQHKHLPLGCEIGLEPSQLGDIDSRAADVSFNNLLLFLLAGVLRVGKEREATQSDGRAAGLPGGGADVLFINGETTLLGDEVSINNIYVATAGVANGADKAFDQCGK